MQDLQEAEAVEWTVGGSNYQFKNDWLRQSIDVKEFSHSIMQEFKPSGQQLIAPIKAGLQAKCDRYKPEIAMGNHWPKWVAQRLAFGESVVADMDDIDKAFARSCLNAKGRVLSRMRDFKFEDELIAVNWHHLPTKTGRLRVVSHEFSPLNLPKVNRHLVTPQFLSRTLVSCDFKALEFRLALKTFGMDKLVQTYDPYMELGNEIGLTGERSEIKEALIAALYGAKIGNLPLSSDQKGKLILWFSENIDPSALVKKWRTSIAGRGFFRNAFGRRVYIEDVDVSYRVLLNNFFQSTGADFTYLKFADLIDYIDENELDAKPIFMIHDSIVLDVDNDSLIDLLVKKEFSGFPVDWSEFAPTS